jgi:nucleoside-diphosphate-sugar epimerase
MKALVTGGAGFLGRYIVERLVARGDQVSIFCRGTYPDLEQMGVKIIRGDIKDPDAIAGACQGQDVVFHVASKIDMWGKKQDYYDTNVTGTRNVVDACLKHHVPKLIYTSTASVVFNGASLENVDESTPVAEKHNSYYPATKAIAEKMVLEANGKNGLAVTVLRPHLIWGPRDPSLLPRLIAKAKINHLPIVGDGKNKLDITYVENVADAHLLAADSPKAAGQVYFITQSEPVVPWDFLQKIFPRINIPPIKRKVSFKLAYNAGAVLEVVYRLFHIYNKEPLVSRFLASELAKSHYFNNDKAKRDLGYVPKVSLAEGVERLIKQMAQDNQGVAQN